MNQSILVADDSLSMRLFFEQNLKTWGYTPIIVNNGKDAIKKLDEDSTINFVILDWEMEGMSGPEVCYYIKDKLTERRGYTYVILVTSRDSKHDKLKGLGAGADDYITKPFDSDVLLARIGVGSRILNYEKKIKNQGMVIRYGCYEALTELAEARSYETGDHMKRIALYASKLAELAGYPEELSSGLSRFTQMHDIGKVGIPDGILHLPRKLNSGENEMIKTHPKLGWEILKDKKSLEMAADIAYSHHEKWDGTGYPRQLKGEEIPLCGRITTIADVYDALRSYRVYKPPWKHTKVVEYIKANSGIIFDPELTKVFIKNNKIFNKIYLENSEKSGNVD